MAFDGVDGLVDRIQKSDVGLAFFFRLASHI